MIGQIITGKDGIPLDNQGNTLSVSHYQPNDEVKKLFARVQKDYQVAWMLQHKPLDEFDGVSLLQRARLDQQLFGAFVGAEYVPKHKEWRWRGRKNTSRNKIIGILAHLIAGMLYPFCYAKNEKNEEDKMTARVMRILVEDHLKKANYEMKFLFAVLSALVNPAVFVEVEYVEAMQRIKQKLADGSYKIVEAVDDLLSGLNIHIVPVDELLISDLYSGTGQIQRLPNIIRVRRIPWDTARSMYEGKYKDEGGKDLFGYVEAGKTKVVMASQEGQILYDIEWTEADRNYVQEITAYYRSEDLEVTYVGGVFMGSHTKPYDNPFKHRRLALVKDEWLSVPIYPFAMSGFEPIDPSGRFAYYKSAAFKEFWDDKALNTMHRLVLDGTYLDVIKPMFLSGVAKTDATVLVPGATVGMPAGATVTPFSVGPNLAAAYNAIQQQNADLSESTQDKIMSGIVEKGVTAYATSKAEQNARIFLGVAGRMVADLVKQIGELTVDCVIQHSTVGELDTLTPEALNRKFKTFLAKGKDKGKEITNRIIFTDEYTGRTMTDDEVREEEWKLYEEAGGNDTDQRIFKVNPYTFARHAFNVYVDADRIIMKSMGADRQEKILAFNMLTDPRVAPYTDPKSVADEVIEEFGGDDPDRFKSKGNPNEMIQSMFPGNMAQPAAQPQQPLGDMVTM